MSIKQWFASLGDVYTMTDWARETKEIYDELNRQSARSYLILLMLTKGKQ